MDERTEEQRPDGDVAEAAEAPDPASEQQAPAGEPAAAGDDSAAEAESELDRLRRERDEYLELAQRTRAELDNYRRRVSGEAAAAGERARGGLARELVPALDNLERALLAAGVDPEGSARDGENPASEEVSAHTALAEGVALVYRELRGALERAGVVGFDPAGERFDPQLHEAVASNPADGDSGVVLETIEKGYRLGEQVLRPARVIVSG